MLPGARIFCLFRGAYFFGSFGRFDAFSFFGFFGSRTSSVPDR
jgi:hypothetical protein